jgi:flagellar basal-body rod protein FlgC
MGINNIFDIAGSGMSAQSDSAASSADQVYKGRHPVFAATYQNLLGQPQTQNISGDEASVGVNVMGIVESDAPLQPRYEPGHPMADDQGYVYYPNVNVVEEMTNMISASRSFQVNVEIMNSAKQMVQRVLSLGE